MISSATLRRFARQTTSNASPATTFTGANLLVTPRPLTVFADAQCRLYGLANPVLTYTVRGPGLINGDTLLGGLATTATETSRAGNCKITQGTLVATENYALTYQSALLSVDRPTHPSTDLGSVFATFSPFARTMTMAGSQSGGGPFTSPGYDKAEVCFCDRSC